MKLAEKLRLLLASGAIALAACSTQAATDAPPPPAAAEVSVHPESGLEIIPVTVISDTGRHLFRSEVAATAAQQQRGLMFRTEMADDEGMIFPYEHDPRQVSFWMRNTLISLDIIYIGTDRKILNIAENAVPYSEQSLPSAGPVSAVLEINGGLSAELGIGPGDAVEW